MSQFLLDRASSESIELLYEQSALEESIRKAQEDRQIAERLSREKSKIQDENDSIRKAIEASLETICEEHDRQLAERLFCEESQTKTLEASIETAQIESDQEYAERLFCEESQTKTLEASIETTQVESDQEYAEKLFCEESQTKTHDEHRAINYATQASLKSQKSNNSISYVGGGSATPGVWS